MEVDITTSNIKCEKCGNTREENVMWRGFCKSGRRFQCKCGAWGHTQESQGNYSYTNRGETSELSVRTDRILTEDELIRFLKIDTNTWKIYEIKASKQEAWRKNKQVDWVVKDGRVISGEVHDTGDILIKPVFNMQIKMRRKTEEIRTNLVVEDLIADAKKFAPKYKKINYPKLKDGMLYEISAFDLHIGKMTWKEESGENSDLKIQTRRITEIFEKLLSYARNYPIERILIPFGGDIFNTDNKFNTTTANTPQDEDTRYQKTFRAGRVLAIDLIDMCSKIAPVDVLVLSGNHDEQKAFYLGEALFSWFHNNPNVKIDNKAKRRKYYAYGKNLVMFVHGSEEKLNKLPGIMAMEEPGLWAKAKFREVHCGDKHHREDILYRTHEEDGVVVRRLSSPSPTDAWHASKGFIGALQGAESFLWHREEGLIAQFTVAATPNTD